MLLESIGADTAVYRAFEDYAARGLLLARVASSQRDRYRLLSESGDLLAEPSGSLWHRTPGPAGMPAIGDWVAARVIGAQQAIVEAVLPRKTLFSRRAAGRREHEQPLAANIDLVFLVCGLDGDYNLRRLERYLSLAAESGVKPVVVLNKADLCADIAGKITETTAVARGAPVVPATSRTPEGIRKLREFLDYGRTVALLGSSGVGKSSIVNCLLGEERLRTNDVRESDSRGRHTTTHRELIPLPDGGALIDTPGMRELQLWAGEQSIDETFDEIAAAASACRFRNCSHSGEDGCAIAAALKTGLVTEARWNSYRKLIAEARRHEEMSDRVRAAEAKKKTKAIHKRLRAFYRQNEP